MNDFSRHDKSHIQNDDDDEGQVKNVHVVGLLGSRAGKLHAQHGGVTQGANEMHVAVGQRHQGHQDGTGEVHPAVCSLEVHAKIITRTSEEYLIAFLHNYIATVSLSSVYVIAHAAVGALMTLTTPTTAANRRAACCIINCIYC